MSGTFERHVTRFDWPMYRAIGRLRAGESHRVAAPYAVVTSFYTYNMSSSSFSVQGSVFRRIDALLGEFRVGGGVHDSNTFQCGLVGYFTYPGIDTR